MYLTHFSLNERPFSISPDPRFLFMSNRYREALAHLTYGVEDGGGFVLLTGEVGTGKTTVCRCLLQQLPDKTRLAFVLNPKLNSLELLATICDELDIPYPENCSSLKILTDSLSQYLLKCYQKGLSVVVMIDEAQNIESEVLEQIRLLTNLETNQKKLLQIILVGQPELQEKLAKRELRQLAQRITARYHLRPLNLKETMAYVLHRIRIAGSRNNLFSRKSIELLHQKTAGIPRLVNTICDRALVAASSRKQNQVSYSIMQEAIYDVMGGNEHPDALKSVNKSKWLIGMLGAVLLVALFSLSYWLGRQSSDPFDRVNAGKNEGDMTRNLPENKAKADIQRGILPQPASAKDPVANQASSQQTLIEQLLGNQRWDNNGLWSMVGLLSLWQVEYSPLSDGNGCDFAANYGLKCEMGQANWQQLRKLNRPVILKFSAGLQGDFWGVLVSLSGSEANLVFGERKVSMSLDKLSTLWTGKYKLIWQSPNGFRSALSSGDRGQAVIWLADKMKELSDPQLNSGSVFNAALKDAVSRYQAARNIEADGIAGMRTILMINSETLDGIPLLQAY